MFRLFARHPAARLLGLLPALLVGSCGNNLGAVITVPNSVVISDLQGNGVLDVVVALAQIDQTGLTQPPGQLSLIMNSTASPGTFSQGATYPTSSAPPSGLAVGDLTGTGTHDLVVANLNAGTVTVFMETSATSGAFNAAVSVPVGGNPNDVQIADINGDGLPDLIVADDTGAVEYLLQNPSAPGTFQAPVRMPISNPAIVAEGQGFVTRGISVAVGDLNGDGLPDIAVTSFDGVPGVPGYGGNNGMVYIFFQDPNNRGAFITTPTAIPAPGEPSQIRIADINKDGANDVVVACQGLGTNSGVVAAEATEGAMVILQNSGAPGTFATPVVYPATAGAISLAVGDLNGDGLPDIAVVSQNAYGGGYGGYGTGGFGGVGGVGYGAGYGGGGGAVTTLMQDPTAPGTFGTGTQYAGLGQPVSIVIGDLNNDGLPDLVTADATSAVWYQNQSAKPGTFATLGVQIGY